jgi:glucan biosynthesis protein C
MQSSGRIYFLDSARAILMLLGIPYHTALIYAQKNEWEFARSDDSSGFLAHLAETIHIFRMPLFFVVAGYFAFMMLSRKGPRAWFGGRTVKLGVPLVAAVFLLNPLSLWAQDDSMSLMTRVGDHWLAHLWFLTTLLMQCGVLALLAMTPLRRRFEVMVESFADRPVLGIVALVVLTSGLSGLGSMLGKHVPDTLVLKITVLSAIGYLPYLLMGVAMRMSPRMLGFMSTSSLLNVVVTMLAVAFLLQVPWGGFSINVVRMFVSTVACIGVARALFAMCRLLLNVPSQAVRKVADASFTVYLVHFPLLNVFYRWVEPAGIPAVSEFLLLVGLVTAASFAIHAVIERSGLLMFLFNGVPMPRRTLQVPLPVPVAVPVTVAVPASNVLQFRE